MHLSQKCRPALCSQRYLLLCLLGSLSALVNIPTGQAASEFQSGFLRQVPGQSAEVAAWALDALAYNQPLAPGNYRVRVRVNQEQMGQQSFEFQPDADGQLQPCLSAAQLGSWGLRLSVLDNPADQQASCLDLVRVVPGAQVVFTPSELQLSLSIPQIAMRRDMTGHTTPEHWDSGINAAFINYQASMLHGNSRFRGRYASHDLYLSSGVNLGEWRLRSTQSWRQDDHDGQQWSRGQTYAQRDLPGTFANITLGETFTDSDVFRGIPVTAVRVASDMAMLSDSQRGYAPIIRGLAQSRSKVEIWQNGYPIYSTYVSAGPYALEDVITSGSGELEVVLTGEDGQVQRFIQPYASVANQLRQGVWRYSATLGRYNPAQGGLAPMLSQATLAIGTRWNATLYGGLMASEHYQAGALGISKDLGGIGALAFDAARSITALDGDAGGTLHGMSYAIKYAKAFTTQTNLRFAGYRYSTPDYRDFDEAINQRSHSTRFLGSRRSRLEASLHQRVGNNSTLTLTMTQQDYWQRNDTQRQFQLNLSTRHRGVSYNLFASQSLNERNRNDRQFGLSVSLPLHFGRSTNATFDLHNNGQGYSQRASISGSASESTSYSATLSQDVNRSNSASLAFGYQGPHTSLGSGMTAAENHRSLAFNASGAVLAHADGFAFAPYLSDTAGLVEIPGVADVGVLNAAGVRSNPQGFALVPSLQPYRRNAVELNTDRVGLDVQLDNGTAHLIPRRGAIVRHRFEARRVSRLVLTLHDAGGQPLPFGAQVTSSEGLVLGMVGQAGQALLNIDEHPQQLQVRWGDSTDNRCQLTLDPEAIAIVGGYRLHTQLCQ